MTKYLVGALIVAAFLTTPASAVDWQTETTHDSDARVRILFVKEIKMHQIEVAAAKKHRRLMREKREAAAAAEAAEATTVTTTAPSASYSGGWADELAAVGFPASVIPTMLYIIDRESGGNPDAINSSSGACGLLQLYPCYGGAAWLDPMTNLHFGFQKYQASGLSPWSM
jgi:soluble lytic murein transglycosylase-like protein